MHPNEAMDELMTCRLDQARKAVGPCTLVIFGASGDLTARKLIPALYHLSKDGQMPADFRIVGFARRAKSAAEWRAELREALTAYSRSQPVDEAVWETFAQRVDYCEGDLTDPTAYVKLAGVIGAFPTPELRQNLLFYLATSPSQFSVVAEQLHVAQLLHRDGHGYWQRLVIEKPFGHDLETARELNHELTRFAHEQQVFRIDHYLGKETVQNILTFRFANSIFERLWNRDAVDHIQITVSEKIGVGSRGGYYEESGALRDMLQNHLMQVLALVTMEPPVSLDAEPIRDEKVKLLSSVRRLQPGQVADHVVRGQYCEGFVSGEAQAAYRDELKVNPQSDVETFVAVKLFIDNWRWAGVPIYLRTGKAMPLSASEVRVQFKPTPNVLFAAQCGPLLDANALTLRLQPDEGISLRFTGKVPGVGYGLRPVRMNFSYDSEFGAYTPEAYERLLLDAIAGDATLFIRRDEVEQAWEIADSIRAGWDARPLDPHEFYPAGNWGPHLADTLLTQSGRAWREPRNP
ncbi:MAG: glucose-6-phosphate dehydrogenase [Verrucomicrobia bacterium]|nr:MAG: glucose-6-phosphate dehydrogenase [Verrucomicrobiota bacterium]